MPPPAPPARRARPPVTCDILWHHQCRLFQLSLMVIIFTWPLNLASVVLPKWVMAVGTVGDEEDGQLNERVYISYGIWKLCVEDRGCYDPHSVHSDVGVGSWLYSVKLFVVFSALLHLVAAVCGALQNFLPREISRHWHSFIKRVLHRKCTYTEDVSFVAGFLGVLSVIIVMLGTQRVISDGGTYSYSFALGFFASSLTLICSIAMAKSRNTARPRPRPRRAGRQRGGDATEAQHAGTGRDEVVIVAVASQEQLAAAELQSQGSGSGSGGVSDSGATAAASATASASASPTAARLDSASMIELGDFTSLGELADTESASLKVQLGAPVPSTSTYNPGDLRDHATAAAAAEVSTERRPLSATEKKKTAAYDRKGACRDPHDISAKEKRGDEDRDTSERGYPRPCRRTEPLDSEYGLYLAGRPEMMMHDEESVYNNYHGNPKRIVRSDPAFYYRTDREYDAYRNDPELDEFARAARRNRRERPDCHRSGQTDRGISSRKRRLQDSGCDRQIAGGSVHQQGNTAEGDNGKHCREKTEGAAASAYWRGRDSRDSAHEAAVTDAQCLEEGEEAREAERRTRWYERSRSRSRSRSRERHRKQSSSGGSRPKRGLNDAEMLHYPSNRSSATPSPFESVITVSQPPGGRLYRTSPLIRSLEMENIPAMFSDDTSESFPAGCPSAESACDGISSFQSNPSGLGPSGHKTPPFVKGVEMKNIPAVCSKDAFPDSSPAVSLPSQPPACGEVSNPQALSLETSSRSEPVVRSVDVEDVRLASPGSGESRSSSVTQNYDKSGSCEQKLEPTDSM